MNTCVFCLEGTEENRQLLYNVKCRCNYHFHYDCYERYTRKTVCPLCRQTVGELYTNNEDTVSGETVVYIYPIPPQITVSVQSTSAPTNNNGSRVLALLCILVCIIITVVMLVTLMDK